MQAGSLGKGETNMVVFRFVKTDERWEDMKMRKQEAKIMFRINNIFVPDAYAYEVYMVICL